MNLHYILDKNNRPVPVEDILVWAKAMGTCNRQLAKDENDDWLLSTVFLGTNLGFGNVPILFETMYFVKNNGEADFSGEEQERYSTYEEAMAGHERFAKLLGMREPPKPPVRDTAPMPGPRKVKL